MFIVSLVVQFLGALLAKAVTDGLGHALHVQPPHALGPLARRRRGDDRGRAGQAADLLLAVLLVVGPPQRAAEDGPVFLGHVLHVDKVGITQYNLC